ncbi:ATPase [Novipirellula caenicola]|uniref:ATPase n=1 Tax=Novipirellula caenicola TaxID=1536901 RepID=A0ABP9VZY5_9BACT
MSHLWIDPNSCESLAILVESVASVLLTQNPAPICLEVDIDSSIKLPANPNQTVDLIRSMVIQAVAEMTEGGELTITAVDGPNGLELEVADTGRAIELRETRIPFAVAAVGARIHWQNCPQGGAAATVVFRPQQGAARIAA